MIRMRKQKGRQIYWGSTSSADYLWGSVIQRLAVDQIRFTNPLMPSGQVLKTWKSLTSYGEDRMAPSLPLLQRGQTYLLEVHMTSRPAHTVMLEIVCQDRFGKMVDRQVSTEGQVCLSRASLFLPSASPQCWDARVYLSPYHDFSDFV